MADDPKTPVDEAHMFEPHFDRHVSIYRENPNGVFTPLNPAVTCAHHAKPKSHSSGMRRIDERIEFSGLPGSNAAAGANAGYATTF